MLLDARGCVIYFCWFFFFGLKVHNMCYFNYVECKFDTALHLFLYFLRLFLFPPLPFLPRFMTSRDDLRHTTAFGFRTQGVSGPSDVFRDCPNEKKSHHLSPNPGSYNSCPSAVVGAKPAQGVSDHAGWYLTRQAFPFRSSYKVYFVKPYSMNVHLVKRRYK